MKDKLKNIRKGGRVERFHTVPVTGTKQTVAAHSWGVASLMIELFPKDAKNPELLKACLYHDMAECFVGDIPAPTKWKYTEFAQLHSKVEDKVLKETGFVWKLSHREHFLLKIVDMLELLFYSVEQKEMGNQYFRKVFSNAVDSLSDRVYNTEQQEFSSQLNLHRITEKEGKMLQDILKEMTEKCG